MTKNSFEIIKATAEETETIVQFQLAMAQESEGTSLDLERLRNGVSKAIEDPAQQTYQRLGMKQTHYLMYEENV